MGKKDQEKQATTADLQDALNEAIGVEQMLCRARGQFVRSLELARDAASRYKRDDQTLCTMTYKGVEIPVWMSCRQFLDCLELNVQVAIDRQRDICLRMADAAKGRMSRRVG